MEELHNDSEGGWNSNKVNNLNYFACARLEGDLSSVKIHLYGAEE